MTLIDDLLGPRVETDIEDAETGAWTISMRPRRHGASVVRTSVVSFHRPGDRSSQGFGVQVWGLRLAARSGEWKDPIAEASITITASMAQQALTWVDAIDSGDGK